MGKVAKVQQGIEFVNVEVKHKAELYFQKGALPTLADLFAWMEAPLAEFWRFGISYNEKSKSYIVSATDKGSMPVDKPALCMSQHGKTVEKALIKVYIVLEVCGVWREGWDKGLDNMETIEGHIDDAIEKILSQ